MPFGRNTARANSVGPSRNSLRRCVSAAAMTTRLRVVTHPAGMAAAAAGKRSETPAFRCVPLGVERQEGRQCSMRARIRVGLRYVTGADVDCHGPTAESGVRRRQPGRLANPVAIVEQDLCSPTYHHWRRLCSRPRRQHRSAVIGTVECRPHVTPHIAGSIGVARFVIPRCCRSR